MHHGETLRKIRRQGDFSQDYIALKLGISQKAYSDLEHRIVINDEKLSEIFEALKITKEEFDSFIDDFNPINELEKEDKTTLKYLIKLVAEQSELIKKLLKKKAKEKGDK